MKIAIIGAGAGIGLLAANKALKRGHTVTALSRNTDNIPDHPNLIKINGSATSASDLRSAITDADTVMITVGTKNKKATTLFSDIAKTLIEVSKDLNFTSPVLVITGFGAGKSKAFLDFFMRMVIRLFLKDQYEDKTKMEELIIRSSLKWEIVRPGILTNDENSSTFRILKDLSKGMKVGKISRANVAEYLVDEAEEPRMINQYVTLTN